MTASLFVRYLEILNRDALKMYPENDFRLFMDNDPKHMKALIVRDFIRGHKINVVRDWPSSSPDLNPSRVPRKGRTGSREVESYEHDRPSKTSKIYMEKSYDERILPKAGVVYG